MRKERLREPISRNELERRWKAVRAAMEKEGLDCLVMQNSNLYLGGYVRYFTDIPAENGYPMSVVFPIDDEITVVSHGGKPLPTTPPEWALYGVKERIALPYLPTLNFTDNMEAEAVEDPQGAEGEDGRLPQQGVHVRRLIRRHQGEATRSHHPRRD